jgi:hypothetical protein
MAAARLNPDPLTVKKQTKNVCTELHRKQKKKKKNPKNQRKEFSFFSCLFFT